MHDTNLLEDQPIAWVPTPDVIERAQLTRFMKQVGVTTWDELYEFSIRDVEKFTEEVLKFLDIKFDPPYEKLLDVSEGVEFPDWFLSPQRRGDAEADLSEPGAVATGSPRNAERGTRSVESDVETRRQEAETRPVGRVSSATSNADKSSKRGLHESEPGAVATGSPANAERGMRNAESDVETGRQESEPGAVATGSHAGLNITTMCLDRWQNPENYKIPRVIWEGEDGSTKTITSNDLLWWVERCAAGMHVAGVKKGDAIGIHLPMIPETVITLLAINRLGAIAVPVFSGYGVDAIASRLNAVGARYLFTCDGFSRRGKFFDAFTVAEDAVAHCSTMAGVFVVKTRQEPLTFNNPVEYTEFSDLCDIKHFHVLQNWVEPTSAEDPLIILYTSGTTGKPKGIAHTHASFPIKAAQDMAFGTDVGRGTRICWYTDIGWMMGPWLIYGALINGATICIYDGAPDYPTPGRMWEFCAKHKVEILGISPTLVRALAAHEETIQSSPPYEGGVAAASADGVVLPALRNDTDESQPGKENHPADEASAPLLRKEGSSEPPHQRHDLSSLRMFASTGEPWNPAPWWWLFEKVGNSKLPIINYSGGTEIAGGILMGNPLLPIKPCSFPAPCPGMDVDILDEQGIPVGPNQVGELVIKQPWIGMARGFWQEKERYLDTYWRRFKNIWVHGDWAMRDKDGHWFILGRSDDTLKVAGKRVGPAEVESLLVAHPLVTEAAVIGVPDEKKGTAMVAFCVLQSSPPSEGGVAAASAEGVVLSDATAEHTEATERRGLETELRGLVAKDMGKPLAPSKIHFVSALPKTRNAKVMRRVLRSAYLGEDPGDLSALENPATLDAIKAVSTVLP
jgi:acetyl-CoA synthetase